MERLDLLSLELQTARNAAAGREEGEKEILELIQNFRKTSENNTQTWNESADTQNTSPKEKGMGDLICYSGLSLPFDFIWSRTGRKAKDSNGLSAPYYASTQDGNLERGELNLSLVQGQWFNYNYDNPATAQSNPSAPAYISKRLTNFMEKDVYITPFEQTVYARVTTSVSLPPRLDQVCKLIRGDEGTDGGIESCGAKAKVRSEVSWNSKLDGPSDAWGEKSVLEAVKARNVEDYLYYEPESTHDIVFKLPAGVSRFTYRFWLNGTVFTSSDAAGLTPGGNYAIAMLDFRNKDAKPRFEILADPFNGNPYPADSPYGGAKISVNIAFYENNPSL